MLLLLLRLLRQLRLLLLMLRGVEAGAEAAVGVVVVSHTRIDMEKKVLVAVNIGEGLI